MNPAADPTYFEAFLPGLVVIGLAAAFLPFVNRDHPTTRFVVVAVCLAVMWRYLAWRLLYTIPSSRTPLDFLVGVSFAIIETLYLIGATGALSFLARTINRSADANRNLEWLRALKRAPLIDVLICTYDEDQSILETTIVAARACNYPNFRVWVCDDTRRPWLRDLCARLDVGYLTRPDNTHAKAGNINAALKSLGQLDDKPDFIAILDADFAPFPQFLQRAAALMRDADVGLVQTPQHFFNVDPIQRNLSIGTIWPDEQRYFFDVVMASKDAWGAAFCCGTSSLIRYDALVAIGGFPTESVTEDYLVSLRLRQNGYRTIYLNEILSLGLAPEGLAEYSSQRSRWCLGFVQICRGSSGPLRIRNRLPVVDRIMLLETFLYWSANHAFRLFAMVAPALYLAFGIVTVNATVPDAIDHIFPFMAALLAIKLWLVEWRVLPIMADVYQLLCAPEVLRAVWAGLVRPREQKFKVTAKGGDRSHRFAQWPMLRPFLFLLAFNILGVAKTFLFVNDRAIEDCAGVALFWSWYNIVVLTIAAFVCIEQPQRRATARFPTDEDVEVVSDGRSRSFVAADISTAGVRLLGQPPWTPGEKVTAIVGGIAVAAHIARQTSDGFALAFDPGPLERVELIRYVFSGRYNLAVKRINPWRVATGVAARVIGVHLAAGKVRKAGLT